VEIFVQKEIALRQLETALALYEAGEDYFSVITLAGAAEEILAKQLRANEVANSLDEITTAAIAISRHFKAEEQAARVFVERANRARNSLKHFRPDGTIELDPQEEARDMLNRAVDNFWRLDSTLTPAMERFTRQQLGS